MESKAREYHAYVEIVGTHPIRYINILKDEDERACQGHSPTDFEGCSCVEGEGKADFVIVFVPTDLVQIRIDKPQSAKRNDGDGTDEKVIPTDSSEGGLSEDSGRGNQELWANREL